MDLDTVNNDQASNQHQGVMENPGDDQVIFHHMDQVLNECKKNKLG